jgi:hypothetical protein
MNHNVNIRSSGAPTSINTGAFKFLRITVATLPFQISFDGSSWENAKQNDYFSKPFTRLAFRAANGLASNVTFVCENSPIAGQDTAQTSQSSSARGCGGSGIALTIKKAKAVGGADYVYNAGAAVDLNAADTVVKVPGIVNGKTRQTIYFDNRNSATDICVFDANGGLWQYLKAGKDTPVFTTSSDFYLGGMGGNSTNFIYTETFYDKANS